MQTFLPYKSFTRSAEALDYRRLGKQRVEVLQLLNTLVGGSKAWVNHPATKMWRGYESELAQYGLVICDNWKSRNYKDTCREKIQKIAEDHGWKINKPREIHWLTDEFCLSHQSNLIRKLPEHYRPIFGPDVPDNLPYIWPV